MQTLVNFLKANGNRQALLSETGGGNTASCITAYVASDSHLFYFSWNLHSLNSELAFIKANSASITGFTAWSAGAFDTTYILTLTPNSNGSDQQLWTQASE